MKKKMYYIVKCGIEVKKIYDKAHIAAYSAQAAFFVLVSAVPMMVLAVILLGILEPFDITGINGVLRQIFAEKISGKIVEAATEIAGYSTIPLMSVTMLFLLWAATRGIRSIAEGISVVYGTTGSCGIVKLSLRSVAFLVAALAAVAFVLPVVMRLWYLRWWVLYGTLALLFAFAYKSLAPNDIPVKNHFAGAAVAAGGWMMYSFGYSVYIRHFSKYSLLYGSFGAVMLFMLWLYMCMNILLCGALLGRILSERK